MSSTSSPPWEVLNLVSHYLDPKTLAISSCVCKSWHITMSSDLLWEPICSKLYPSLTNLRRATSPSTPYHRLFSTAHTAATRRVKIPFKPLISLEDIVFALDIRMCTSSRVTSIIMHGDKLVEMNKDGVFKVDMDVPDEKSYRNFCPGPGWKRDKSVEKLDNHDIESELSVLVTWNVVLRGWRGVFTMMECEGKMGFSGGAGEGWFSQQLPAPPCCSSAMASGIMADVKVGFGSYSKADGKMKVEKVRVGILSIVDWRYVSVDDGLRYLQQFLLP